MASTLGLQEVRRLLEPQFLETGNFTGSCSLACDAETSAHATRNDERKREPTEDLGNVVPSEVSRLAVTPPCRHLSHTDL